MRKGQPKPPKGESETGYYRYNGTPIQQKDKVYYEMVGCKFHAGERGDLMPDEIHLKPRRIRTDNRLRKGAILEEITTEIYELRQQYETLPEPRPNFMDWAAANQETQMTEVLLGIIKNRTEATQTRLKAMSMFLEFTKSKPKSQLEVSQPAQPMTAMTPQELLVLAYELNGITPQDLKPQPIDKKALN
jgi:hypothetical protein